MGTDGMQIYQADAQVGELKLWRAPEEVLVEAQQAAQALQKRIANKKKPDGTSAAIIYNGKQYIENDDWQMVCNFFGYSPKIVSCDYVEYGGAVGFKAIAELINERTGMVVSRGEALCLDEEDNWGEVTKYEYVDVLDGQGKKIWDATGGKNGKGAYRRERVEAGTVAKPLFQLASMAQTRACNKAMSNKVKWVVSLAGYSTTPAEDMHDATMSPQKEQEPPLPTEIKRKEPPLTPQQNPPAVAQAPVPPSQPAPRQAAPVQRPPVQQPRPQQVRVISEPQARRFYAICKQNGRSPEQVREYLQARCGGITDDRQIPSANYEAACKWAETGDDF